MVICLRGLFFYEVFKFRILAISMTDHL